MNLESVKARSRIVQLVRRWFDDQGFLEMLTPRLVGLPGQEPYLEPFWTTVNNPLDKARPERSRRRGQGGFPAALVTSPEYAMKRLLAAGLDKIYDLGPCFRNNEPWDGSHDPEFLMLEWYRRDSNVEQLMDDAENMIRWVAGRIKNEEFRMKNAGDGIPNSEISLNLPLTREISYSESPLVKGDLGDFRRLTVEQAWREYAGVELAPLLDDREALAKVAVEKFHQTVTPDDTWDDIYFRIFLSVIEPKLGWPSTDSEDRKSSVSSNETSPLTRRLRAPDPVFLYRYPASQASLACKCADDPRWAERVELYIGPYELANGFAELRDPVEQRARFDEERGLRSRLGKKTWPSDEKFLADLPRMGNAAGIAFGVERLAMLLTGAESINDILPFPARERFDR